MGRGATKASGNAWYEARMEAAKKDERLLSREGAAERVGMSVDAIKNTELGLEKCMPVDKAVLLADAYGAPQLLNHYCLYECPIGRNMPISDEDLSLDRITVKLMKNLHLKDLGEVKKSLIDIAEDGTITKDEIPDLIDVMSYFDDLAKTISELRVLTKKALNGAGFSNGEVKDEEC